MNVGQLGWVKLLPNPPSKGCGNDEPALGAVTIELDGEFADEAEVDEGETIEEDPVSVEATALAVEEKVGLAASVDFGVEDVTEGEDSAEEPKRSPF